MSDKQKDNECIGTRNKIVCPFCGYVDGDDRENTDEFHDLNYYLCPVQYTKEKVWSNHYVMRLREDMKLKEEVKIANER